MKGLPELVQVVFDEIVPEIGVDAEAEGAEPRPVSANSANTTTNRRTRACIPATPAMTRPPGLPRGLCPSPSRAENLACHGGTVKCQLWRRCNMSLFDPCSAAQEVVTARRSPLPDPPRTADFRRVAGLLAAGRPRPVPPGEDLANLSAPNQDPHTEACAACHIGGRPSLVTPWLTPCQHVSWRIELLPLNQAPPRDGPCRDRTCDLGIKSPLLYQLS